MKCVNTKYAMDCDITHVTFSLFPVGPTARRGANLGDMALL